MPCRDRNRTRYHCSYYLDDLLNIIATVANEVVSRLHTPTPTARVKPEVAKLVAETLAAEAPEEVASA